jgi:hypothetical protein
MSLPMQLRGPRWSEGPVPRGPPSDRPESGTARSTNRRVLGGSPSRTGRRGRSGPPGQLIVPGASGVADGASDRACGGASLATPQHYAAIVSRWRRITGLRKARVSAPHQARLGPRPPSRLQSRPGAGQSSGCVGAHTRRACRWLGFPGTAGCSREGVPVNAPLPIPDFDAFLSYANDDDLGMVLRCHIALRAQFDRFRPWTLGPIASSLATSE